MKSGRFFVTSVLILGTAAFLACTGKTDQRAAQVNEGNRQIQTAAAVQTELNTKYKVSLDAMNAFDWNALSKNDRQVVRERLAEYVSAVSRTFEIDAKKGLYITQKEVLQRHMDNAILLQKSLEQFERTYGENFEPKKPADHA